MSLNLFLFFLLLPVTTTSLSVRVDQIKQPQPQPESTTKTSSSNSIPSLIKQHHNHNIQSSSKTTKPISNSVLFLPSEYISNDVVYLQKATNTRIIGLSKLQSTCENWENIFQSDLHEIDDDEDDTNNDVQMNLCRIQTLSPSTVLVQWNITWHNPTTFILKSIAKFNNWIPDYRSYTHLSNQVSKFSYLAIFKLFYDAVTTQKLRIPLACLEGTSILEFAGKNNKTPDDGNDRNKNNNLLLVSISEDLKLAQDLQQRPCTLLNRKCAQDLRLFLETARRIDNNDGVEEEDSWDDIVATKLPWSSVPGMGPLDIEESSDDPIVAVLFLTLSALTILVFAALTAPELIGQSLIGPPTYVVPPEELNSIY